MTESTPVGPRPLPGQEGTPAQRGALAVAGVVAVVALSLAAVLARPALAETAIPGDVPAAPTASSGRTTEVTVTIEGMAFEIGRASCRGTV